MKISSLFTISTALTWLPTGILASNAESDDSDCHIWVRNDKRVPVGYGKAVTGRPATVRINYGEHQGEKWTFNTHADQSRPQICSANIPSGQPAFHSGWMIKTFKSEPWLTYAINNKPVPFENYGREEKTKPMVYKMFTIPHGEMGLPGLWFIPLRPRSKMVEGSRLRSRANRALIRRGATETKDAYPDSKSTSAGSGYIW
ncbi:uncharacterized protein PpBr36_10297 [Pyricularia pennisetigena]|uniref:uncharacterized protein n=1 Tax=Pyricularia pennisetigena TaxID=1578925 RepID=UPI0011539018|nr:uncharacterized protein PpBr36_10297 [Pyricularia pennisetigena]TLS21564.1 hypothetical protein PpBr36_10297 [Pyricularia pennisetigena]